MCGFFSILALRKIASLLKIKLFKHTFFLLVFLFLLPAVFSEVPEASAQDKPGNIRVTTSTGNRIEILLPLPAQKNVRLQVTDVLGRNIKDSTIAYLPEPGRIAFSLSEYRQGLYFIRIYYQQHVWYNRFLYEPAINK